MGDPTGQPYPPIGGQAIAFMLTSFVVSGAGLR
jgi:hypothetical protein